MKFFRLLILLFGFTNSVFALININTADYGQLMNIKGVGPKKAQAIIEYRNTHGKFNNINELYQLKGFGASVVKKISSQLEVK